MRVGRDGAADLLVKTWDLTSKENEKRSDLLVTHMLSLHIVTHKEHSKLTKPPMLP